MNRETHNKFSYRLRRALAVAVVAALALAYGASGAFAGDDETIINAGLVGAPIGGQTPVGKAEFRERPGNDRKLEVEVQDVNLPAGTVLNVFVGGAQVATLTVNSFRAGEVELETERGQAVPAVSNGTSVAVRNAAGANVVAGTFGSAGPLPTPSPGATPNPTPSPGASPSPSPSPSPTPTPGATPSPTPVLNEIEADLVGAPINGVTPRGDAEFSIEPDGREFRVRVENVNLPAGTQLRVLVDNQFVGNIAVAPSLDRSELKLKTEDGQVVPQVNPRTRVVVATAAGVTVVAGSFGANVPAPGPAPMPTPDASGRLRIEARLAGAPINGLTPSGHARFRKEPGRRDFNVEVERVNLPLGTILSVFVDGVKLGDLPLRSTLENELELNTNDGQNVPDLTTASSVVVTNPQGQTILSGVFNTTNVQISSSNDVDDTRFFVEQQYRDFLGREADDGGLGFWSAGIANCNGDASCVEAMRVNTSAAFFLSIEFQETGYLLYRFNKASYGVMPRRNQFLVDMQAAAQGVVVGQAGWEARLEANKQAIAAAWVARPEFRGVYDSLSNAQFVERLFANAGVTPTQSERDALVNGLNNATETRATVLRKVADNAEFRRRESNPAFVLMQYFGYLHRNPDEGRDTNMDGFNFWLGKLNEHGGDFQRAEMVRAFISSIEYRERFQW